jgi:ABC-type polar amino acid transport system ATPase subunit
MRDVRLLRGDRVVLDAVSLSVDAGEICALMGISGAGKSTALRAVAGLERIDAGTITVGEFTLAPETVRSQSQLKPLRANTGLVFQSSALFDHLTVLDNVTLALRHVLRWPRERADEHAHSLLESLGVGARAHALPRQISGGEAQRVAIARVLALDPILLLMDEPTSALDPGRRSALGESLRDVARSGRGLLIATHDVDFARTFADRVFVLFEGHIVESGAAGEVLSAPRHEGTRALLHGEGAGAGWHAGGA